MMVKGNDKGGAFERAMAKKLSLWITHGEDRTQLIRSKSSGGWGSNVGDEKWRQLADLAPNGKDGERFRKLFGVECKHRKDLTWWCLFTQKANPDTNITGFWEKLCAEVEESSIPQVPMLLVRFNYRPLLAGFPGTFVEGLPGVGSILSLSWGEDASSGEFMPPSGQGWEVSFVQVDELLNIPPEHVFEIAARYLTLTGGSP